MTFNLKINTIDAARLMRLLVSFPRETYRGLGRAGAAIRSKMRKLMRRGGGSDGVSKFRPLNYLTTGVHPGRPMGGKLSQPSAIQMYRQGKGALVIGFVSALVGWAKPFQESENRAFTKGERYFFHKYGLQTPERYVRPARNMVEPFAEYYRKEFVEWALKATNKILMKAGKI
jgi:hypothetical protein